jgi:predicted ester cyclase
MNCWRPISSTIPIPSARPAGVKAEVAALRVAFPDAMVTIEDMISEGDRVAVRFVLSGTHCGMWPPSGGSDGQSESVRGFAPTGRQTTLTGMDFVRIAGGKIAELWSSQDTLGWLLQLGMKLG